MMSSPFNGVVVYLFLEFLEFGPFKSIIFKDSDYFHYIVKYKKVFRGSSEFLENSEVW